LDLSRNEYGLRKTETSKKSTWYTAENMAVMEKNKVSFGIEKEKTL
jgi:hypothetical protein